MTISSNVPEPTFGDTGFVAPTEADILAWLAPLLLRVHSVSLSEASLIVGLGFGLPNAIGQAAGGAFADRLARHVSFIAWSR